MGETIQKTIFGEWLRKRIDEKGMTISAVARMSGYSREHLYKLMAGDSGTKIETVDALAKAIGISSKEAREAWYSSIDESAPPLTEILVKDVDFDGSITGTRTYEQELLLHLSDDIRDLKRLYDALSKKMDLMLEKIEAKG